MGSGGGLAVRGGLAVSGGESDAAFVETGYKLAPYVSGAGVETEDAALHAITETSEPCLGACLAFKTTERPSIPLRILPMVTVLM